MKNSLKAAISIAAAIGALALPAGTASATSNPPPNGGGIACLPETITDPTAPQWEEITLITQGQGICVAANGGAGYYELAMQYDGNLVLYNPYGHAIWSTNTWNTVASYAIMQDDGNFVLYDWNKHPYWDSKTWGHPGSYLYLQADGNLVVYAPGGGPVTGHALWASGTYGK